MVNKLYMCIEYWCPGSNDRCVAMVVISTPAQVVVHGQASWPPLATACRYSLSRQQAASWCIPVMCFAISSAYRAAVCVENTCKEVQEY